jgi:hypothetical protein
MFWKILAIALLMNSAAYGQSLGDIARENREKQISGDASPTAKPKVITNKDLPKDPDANPAPSATPPGAATVAGSKAAESQSADRLAEQRFAEQRLAEQRAAEQWKRQILAQKNKMATLQARIDQIHASVQSAGGSVQSEPPYNRYQAQRVAQIQQQLKEQKRKLDRMQEAARHAGMHTAVYDP